MSDNGQELMISLIAVTVVLAVLVSFIVSFALFFQRRQFQFRQEKQTLKQTYDRALLQSQLETQNQTLQTIGQELHDNIGQMLSVAMLQLNGLEETLDGSPNQPAVGPMIETIEATIQAVRQLAKTLDSGTVHRFGLRDSVALDLERIQRTGRYQTHLHITGEPYSLGADQEIILFRITQEALNNALKHAHGHSLTVAADYQPTRFALTIADDGQGFSPGDVATRSIEQAGSGLSNLQHRAGLLGGQCTIDSRPGTGTRIRITLPR